MKLVLPRACGWLARMLRRIEQGAEWPVPALEAKAAFLHKGEGDLMDPMCYRLLSIMSVLYRSWAKARLKDLREWVKGWAMRCFRRRPGAVTPLSGPAGMMVTAKVADFWDPNEEFFGPKAVFV